MIPTDTFKKTDEYETVTAAIAKASATAPLDDWIAFAKATKLKKAQLNKVRPFITEKDATAVATNEPDTELRDTENIPFTYEGGIEAFMQNEVLTYAQVKEKYGIIERENYNKPKSENSKQPQCPAEKVEMIEEALRHFKMI